ncbi:kinase-like protein [Rhizophagus irregularis]|uniref:Kinase-like protein n=1 Tax=Rhizophagus irregularis TaxID=588596 RepID=A0A2I1H3K6_9GLOM|nr:kinase-like protein [Rhizophagus irregularis]
MSQLNEDCLYEIFKNLDGNSLYSCLLVSRLWCSISVRLLWRDRLDYKTLLSCLPNESMDILRANNILVPTLITPFINYASFCKKFLLDEFFHSGIKKIFNNELNDEKLCIVSNEILKLLVNQASLKELYVYDLSYSSYLDSLVMVNTFLQDLEEFYCHSGHPSYFYNQLSHICRKIRVLNVTLDVSTSDSLADFISAQKNLEKLSVWQFKKLENENRFFSKIPHSIIDLTISGINIDNLYSLLNNFNELKKLNLSLMSESNYNKFDDLNLSKLEVLIFSNDVIQPTNNTLIRFLDTHGTNIKIFSIKNSDNLLNNYIARSCQNIKEIYTGLDSHTNLEIFEMFIKELQYLESIKINISGNSNEKEIFEIIKDCSQENFYNIELKYLGNAISTLLPADLNTFILDWKERKSHKLSIIFDNTILSSENMDILTLFLNYRLVPSGNTLLDEFLNKWTLKWFPLSIEDITYLDKGGNGTLYKSIIKLKSGEPVNVVLKCHNNINENINEFLTEWKYHQDCLYSSAIINLHGFTKISGIDGYMVIMDYASKGSLRENLQTISKNNWEKKLYMLFGIISGLNDIHHVNLIHCDFHDGNILIHEYVTGKDKVFISDLGLCRPIKSSLKKDDIYGVIPFMAPEILRGNSYTKASDIYSFSMIMWKFTSGVPPFNDKDHNLQLSLDICRGERPEIPKGIPQCYTNLMKRCWDEDPNERPSTSEVFDTIKDWIYFLDKKKIEDIEEEKKKQIMEFINAPIVQNNITTHPRAFYTSRLLNFNSVQLNKNLLRTECLECMIDD